MAAVFKSVDGGATWSSFSSGLPLSRWVAALAIDPRNPSVLYAATERGVFESTDGGTSWSELAGGPRPGSISSLTIDPQDSNKLYAAGAGGVFRIVLRQKLPIRAQNEGRNRNRSLDRNAPNPGERGGFGDVEVEEPGPRWRR